MNSLSYLSRQFDYIASPRAPPSTPVFERNTEILGDDAQGIKRVKTWSKPFAVQPSPVAHHDVPPSSPKRSYSSPPGIVFPTIVQRPSPPPPLIRVKASANDNILRRMFFVRVFVALCNAVREFWQSVMGLGARARTDVTVEEGSEAEGKESDSDTETKDELLFTPPPSSLASSVTPALAIPPHLPRSRSDTATLSEDKPSIPVTETLSSSSTRKTPFHLPKTLVLDLDETLIHSTSKPLGHSIASRSGLLGWFGFGKKSKGTSHIVEVMLGGRRTVYHVYKRPFVDYFLRKVPYPSGPTLSFFLTMLAKVSTWYTLVIFTASMQEYADPVIDWLDAGRGILERRLFREVGSYAILLRISCLNVIISHVPSILMDLT
jgi:CTD nuclear envelope phosphatase 1